MCTSTHMYVNIPTLTHTYEHTCAYTCTRETHNMNLIQYHQGARWKLYYQEHIQTGCTKASSELKGWEEVRLVGRLTNWLIYAAGTQKTGTQSQSSQWMHGVWTLLSFWEYRVGPMVLGDMQFIWQTAEIAHNSLSNSDEARQKRNQG